MAFKLVRDRIPERLRELRVRHRVAVASERDYHGALVAKVVEEVEEYRTAGDRASAAEELADLLEVVLALAGVHGLSGDELEVIRARKAADRGAFAARLLLEVECLAENSAR